jgi:hypothetical protein
MKLATLRDMIRATIGCDLHDQAVALIVRRELA